MSLSRRTDATAPTTELPCEVCQTLYPAYTFGVKTDNRPSGTSTRYRQYCARCNKLRNSLRRKVNGKLAFPSMAEVRAALGNGATPATRPTLRSAGHTGRRTRLARTPEVQHALGVLRDARGQREGQQGYVYLIVEALLDAQGRDTGNVSLNRGKIGYSTNPDARVAELQEGNSRPLRLYAAKPGTEADEKALHTKYVRLNILQEWFRLTADVLLEWDVKHIRIGRKAA